MQEQRQNGNERLHNKDTCTMQHFRQEYQTDDSSVRDSSFTGERWGYKEQGEDGDNTEE